MVTRISGVNSGLDIDKMVSDLMKAERMPLDKLQQKKTSLSWKTDLYREINTKLASFKTTLDSMRLSGDWKQNIGTSSNDLAVSISADATASPINHSILITGLATGATAYSSGAVSKNSLLAGSLPTTIITAGVNDQLNVTLGGVTKKITLVPGSAYTDVSLASQLQTQVDSAFGTGKLTVASNGGKLEFKSVIAGTYAPPVVLGAVQGNAGITDLGFADQQSNRLDVNAQLGTIASQFNIALTTGDFMINGQSITFSSTDTLNSIINKVNNSSAGVNMSYDTVTDKFTFTTKDTGAAATINLQNGSSNFLAAANLTAGSVAGVDANVTIDGVQSYRNSNTFVSSGVTYNLKQTTSTAVSVSVSQDVDSTVKKIKDFVNNYNDTIDLLNKRTRETKFRDYAPLTDAQKSAMQAQDITIWEDKAKSGLLHNDDIIKSAIDGLRSLVSTSVASASSKYNALYKAGISTMSYNMSNQQDAGKLVLDENQLRKALADDPANVIALFSNQPDGIAQKMYNQANKTITSLVDKAGGNGTVVDSASTDLGGQISKLNNQITDFNAKLTKKEDYYYKMFSAMDTAVGKSNSTLAWLSKQ
jgi:flagellar hook-associated protein 2